jgi:1,4-alpha-glucan branching enzyme
MSPQPTPRPGLLRIPGPGLTSVNIRFAPLSDRPNFAPGAWPQHALTASASFAGWWEFDLDALQLDDAVYEYEFVVSDGTIVPDPYAARLTRFGGYRGLFTISGGVRIDEPFAWDDEFTAGVSLPQNNQMVIYEMPVKWMASDPGENAPLVELGTFDAVLFEHLEDLAAMGVNCIELLPIEDSPQTLNWGYGTRFFFAPDYDIGSPVDAKFFIKTCHQRGIRVFLDVVMNMYAPKCPLGALASSWFSQAPTANRQNWGQVLFLYDTPAYGDYYAAREFLCEMAEFWISEYHVDGYRIDDFADINNWDFVQEFHDRATARSQGLFPGKPFLVVAEDSDGRFVTTSDDPDNPNGRKVVDAIWNFGYLYEIRRLLTNSINTIYGQPSRTERVQHLISNSGVWNDWNQSFDPGFSDMSCSVPYITSHDVASAPRLMNVLLGPMLSAAGLGDGGVANVRNAVDSVGANPAANPTLSAMVSQALQQCFGGFAILMTSVGMPMFLAGEEFGDVHDLSFTDVNKKQQDPVQWARAGYANNAQLLDAVTALIQLRTSHPALERDEVECFYFHPQFDDDNAARVFAYCRTADLALGSPGQVIVIANMGPQSYPVYSIPAWPWVGAALTEIGYPNTPPVSNPGAGTLTLSLGAFSARVFRT